MRRTLFVRNRAVAEKILERLNEKCDRFGAPRLTYTWAQHPVQIRTTAGMATEYIEKVEILGETPTLKGWRIIASFTKRLPVKDKDGTLHEYPTIYYRLPAEHLPLRFRNYVEDFKRDCDHCNMKRDRIHVYVLEQNNEHKQVGSTCLQDFFGGRDIRQMLDAWEAWESVSKDNGFYENADDVPRTFEGLTWNRQSVMLQALALVRLDGFHPKSKGEFSTAARLRNVLERGEYLPASLDDMQGIIDLEEYIAARASNDFEYELQRIFGMEYINHRHLGYIAASVGPTLQRARQKRTLISDNSGEYFGEIGKKYAGCMAYINSIGSFDSNFGRQYVVNMTVANCAVVWITANPGNVEAGQLKKATMTVKSHEPYKGESQTKVLRVKWQ